MCFLLVFVTDRVLEDLNNLYQIAVLHKGALTLGHLAVAVAVFTPNRAEICQCECGQSGQANLATWERCAATVRAATVKMLMSRYAHTHGYAT
jgi:hypothetical protein